MWAEGPRVVTVDLVVYEVTIGNGTKENPTRVVRYVGLPDGTKLCRYGTDAEMKPDYQVFPNGFNQVWDTPTAVIGGDAE